MTEVLCNFKELIGLQKLSSSTIAITENAISISCFFGEINDYRA